MITKAKDVLYDLEKAIYLAKSGRPGHVGDNLDIQANGGYKKMKRYVPPRIAKIKKNLIIN